MREPPIRQIRGRVIPSIFGLIIYAFFKTFALIMSVQHDNPVDGDLEFADSWTLIGFTTLTVATIVWYVGEVYYYKEATDLDEWNDDNFKRYVGICMCLNISLDFP